MKAKDRKHAYVVGYEYDWSCVYGRRNHNGERPYYLDPLTLLQAKRALKAFPSIGKRVVLYELVPAETRVVTEEDSDRWRKAR